MDSVDASRLKRLRGDEPIRTIAENDRVSVAAVRSSIKQAKTREHEAELIQYVKMKLEGRTQNERRRFDKRNWYHTVGNCSLTRLAVAGQYSET